MHKVFILLLFIFSAHLLGAQSPLEVRLLESIPAEASFIRMDALGNLYWIDQQGLHRYEPASRKRMNYNNPRFGPLQFVDPLDPLNILLYYPQSGMIEFLDKNLAPRSMPGLPPDWMQSVPPALVASSAQQGFWAIFTHPVSLKRYDASLRQVFSLDNIQGILPDLKDPVFMVEAQNQLYISCLSGIIFVFDRLGNFLFRIPAALTTPFQITGENIIFFIKDQIKIFNYNKRTEKVYLLPEQNVERGFVQGQLLMLQTSRAIHLYQIRQGLF